MTIHRNNFFIKKQCYTGRNQQNRKCFTGGLLRMVLSLLMIITFVGLFTNASVCQQQPPSFPIYIAKFFEPGCHDCDKAEKLLEEIAFEYPQLEIRNFDICQPEGVEMAEQLGEIYHVPEDERLLVPIVFIGDDYLLRGDINYKKIVEQIEKLTEMQEQEIEIVPPWERLEKNNQSAANRLVERFHSFGWGAVAFSGLIDGINPCAFATIIFFISYLTMVNRKGKELLWVGGMFTFAVFLTYFLIGTGALKVVTTLSFLPLVRKIFCFATALLGFILGFLSLSDYLKFKRTGETGEATLQLPSKVKKMIHSVIRQNVKTHSFVLMAAATGFLVSVLELACTGQIYLPTLIFISNVPELRINAMIYLLLYNLMFVVPLILVFMFTYWGTSSQQWAELTRKNFGNIKLLMTFLFLGLAILLFITGVIY